MNDNKLKSLDIIIKEMLSKKTLSKDEIEGIISDNKKKISKKVYSDNIKLLDSEKIILFNLLIKKYPKESKKLIDNIKNQKLIIPKPKTCDQVIEDILSINFKSSDLILEYHNEDDYDDFYEEALQKYSNDIIYKKMKDFWFKIKIDESDFSCDNPNCEIYRSDDLIYRLNISYDYYKYFDFCSKCKKHGDVFDEHTSLNCMIVMINKKVYKYLKNNTKK